MFFIQIWLTCATTTQLQSPSSGISEPDSPEKLPPLFRRPCGRMVGNGGAGGGGTAGPTDKTDLSR